MRDEFQVLERSYDQLSAQKRICTGTPFPPLELPKWPQEISSEALFRDLVSRCYILWRESWKQDIWFLLGLGRSNDAAKSFDQLIYALRTSHQHTGNERASRAANEWFETACGGSHPAAADDWQSCGHALIRTMVEAITDLSSSAAWARKHQRLRQAWREKGVESIESTVASVAADLGLRLQDGTLAHHVRQVERRWSRYRLRAGEEPDQALAALAEADLVSRLSPLRCSYLDVLDELNVLGSRDAVPALLLAHGVAGVSGLSGEALVRAVATIWAAFRS